MLQMTAHDSSTIAVLAEKPSVARDIARVLGASKKGQGYLQGNGYVVTWAIGHLVSLAQPHEINPQWRQWRFDSLPMLPSQWPLVVYERSKDQFEVVRKILTSPRVSQVVCATDAGREGELIFRYIYESAQCDKPVSRLWISSMTAEAIRKGFDHLRPGSEYDRLADAASGRSRADWLVGMNLSRAYSLLYREDLSVGRVQTPTLAMLVDRELALRSFNSEEYIEIVARFEGQQSKDSYLGTWFLPKIESGKDQEAQAKNSRLPADGEEAKEIIARARVGQAIIESVASETQRTQPPLLYDLTELQRHANRLFGLSAQDTLNLAQALYEKHKLISYPRTDSRHISADVAATVAGIVREVAPAYQKFLAPGTGVRPLSKRYVDDSKVTDHHAILPNAVSAAKVTLSEDERKIYDLICRRFLTMWHEDQVQAVTTVITAITTEEIVDRYQTKGTLVQQEGWKVLDLKAEKRKRTAKTSADEKEPEQILPVSLAEGQQQKVAAIEAKKKKTKPPKRFTEGTLLTAMQTAGQSLDEKELSEAMKETGLGTPATRAAIIEVLLKRGYIIRSGKSLEATEKGVHLIEVVHPEAKSPAMTGQWEAFLKKIQQGEEHLDPFLAGISDYVRSVVDKVRVTPRARFSRPEPAPSAAEEKEIPARPKKQSSSAQLTKLLQETFGFTAFLPKQKSVCQALMTGTDALLVLPAGSGKSFCYQLAGLARGGTTLVLSAQIAWMEEQMRQMKERGFAVACLHEGLDRETSRSACIDYLSGKLQFFLVAPERFSVEGVPAMLAKRKPSLIAVEDAHFVVQSSPDYRSDYGLLTRHMQSLRPAPILALTATATPLIQKEIAAQLGLSDS
jgi:DNA topoisomerase-3